MNYRVSKKGFTLIELLIVISIIGILAVALLPNVLNAPKRARDAARKSDIATIVKAVETFNVDTGAYPVSFCTGTGSVAVPTAELNKYFSGGNAPKDPSGLTYVNAGGTCNGGYLFCRKSGNPFAYAIVTKMEGAGNNSDAAVASDCSDTAAYAAITPGTTNYVVAQ